ncbi:MAG: hypothetical protein FJ288_07875 [Planctomycetes bacterium]|nr:hypothetical protein [Planctomycetota bacterium]
MLLASVLLSAALLAVPAAGAAAAPAPAAEDVLAPWLPFWSREPGAGQMTADKETARNGRPTVRIEHRGQQDWSLTPKARIRVEQGDLFEVSAWVKIEGSGEAALCAVTYGPDGKARDWMFGQRSVGGPSDWRQVNTRLFIPPGVAEIVPRLIGEGKATVWLDAFAAKKEGNVRAFRGEKLPPEVSVSSAALAVSLNTTDGALAVKDRRTGRAWEQRPLRQDVFVKSARDAGGAIEAVLLDGPSSLDVKVTVAPDASRAEVAVTLEADGPLPRAVAWPLPFLSRAGEYLVIPMNEGISYPVDDKSISPMRLIAYGGHGICMGFFGATDGAAGYVGILETADDAAIRIDRVGGLLTVQPEWDAQKGRFGYARRLRYAFFDSGGHVAIAKRYRRHAADTGLLKTLAEKRKDNPNVDLLIGAANVWCWDKDAPAVIRDLQTAGIQRILWSNRQPAANLAAMNEMPGVLTSRYDIYQDVMDPANFPRLRGVHGDWPTEAWPKDIMVGPKGDWTRGWQVRTKDGEMVPCGVLCDRQAPAYAERRIGEELKTSPYRSRFIDTTTASSWRECYNPAHPMTRSESRKFKMDLLALVSQKFRLVCGSETGHDAAVPYVHYFEGMLSLGPYRVPDAGRDMQRIWDEVPERVARFQLGHAYRLPLWELVYHDCVVAQWYWGDYNNKLPALWDKRDLFNALYGTPPMFMFTRDLWQKNRERFVRSYTATCPVARAAGYSEMLDHKFLSADRSVQRTAFAGGVTVTVNFGDKPFRLPDGAELAAGACRAAGVKE